MNELFEKLKSAVIQATENPEFRHHKWYVKYHIEIAEQIAMELCDVYKDADRELVRMLIWFHDYGKMLDFENQHQKTLTEGKTKLLEIGLPSDLVDKIINYINVSDQKKGLDKSDIPIEIKILSSADGASHFIGPFYGIFWHENSSRTIESILESWTNKANLDWEKKIVLPEVRKVFLAKYNFILELSGELPEQYLK